MDDTLATTHPLKGKIMNIDKILIFVGFVGFKPKVAQRIKEKKGLTGFIGSVAPRIAISNLDPGLFGKNLFLDNILCSSLLCFWQRPVFSSKVGPFSYKMSFCIKKARPRGLRSDANFDAVP